jgi:hypothetical protein
MVYDLRHRFSLVGYSRGKIEDFLGKPSSVERSGGTRIVYYYYTGPLKYRFFPSLKTAVLAVIMHNDVVSEVWWTGD